MDVQTLLGYFQQYGAIFIFAVVFLEYLNLPGFPAGVILPLSGLMASLGRIGILVAIIVTVFAGLLGSWALYGLGRAGGHVFLNWFYKKFPKKKDTIDKYINFVQSKGFWGIFIAKLIPMIRTLVSIPAGAMKMGFLKYTVSSTLGILVWNTVFIAIGYFAGESIFSAIL